MKVYKTGEELFGFIGYFKNIPFFRSFGDECLETILRASKLLVYEPGEMIIAEGGIDDNLYVLFNGKANVFKDKLQVASIDEVGEVFGELSMLGKESRSASVRAADTTWCLVFNATNLRKLPAENHAAVYAVLYGILAKTLADRLWKTTEELAIVNKELEMTRAKLEKSGSGQESR